MKTVRKANFIAHFRLKFTFTHSFDGYFNIWP